MATLVVFYSHAGHTATVARVVADRLDATIEAIEEPRPRNGAVGLITGGAAALFGRPSVIKPTARDPSCFDLVILGTPVWVGAPAPAINAYIERHRRALGRVAFLATQARSGADTTFARMERRLGYPPIATLDLAETELSGPAFTDKLERFLSGLDRDVA